MGVGRMRVGGVCFTGGENGGKAKGRLLTLNQFNGVIFVEKLKMNDFKYLLGFGYNAEQVNLSR